jgi:hypothetical protein
MTKTLKAPEADSKRVRFTIELTKRLDEILDDIASENGSTKAEVLRFAIDFLEAGMKAKKDGLIVGGWQDDNEGVRKRERVFVGL